MRAKHPVLRMVQVYLHWFGCFLTVHDKRHPLDKTAAVASVFSALSVGDHVLLSEQNQALSAWLLLCSAMVHSGTTLERLGMHSHAGARER